jgi:hypothetical protein
LGGKVAEEYSWGESFQKKLLAWYITEPRVAYPIVEPFYFTNPIFVDICRLMKEVVEKQERGLIQISKASLAVLVKDYLGKRRSDVWPLYKKVLRDAFEEKLEDLFVIRDKATHFAKDQKYRKTLVDCEKDINAGDFNKVLRRLDTLKTLQTSKSLGINYWENINDPHRWDDDRRNQVATHFLPRLDRKMGGGPGGGELAIILAPSKAGKSSLIARFAAGALWQNKNVAVATGELSKEKYRKRIDAMVTQIPANDLTKASAFRLSKVLRHARKRLKLSHKQMKGNLHIQQWPTGRGTPEAISQWLDDLEAEFGYRIDVLFVDYIRVFKPTNRMEEQRLAIGEVAIELRGIATERDIPVWTATQTNRAGLDKAKLSAKDIAEDISQLFTLDFLVAFSQTDEEKDETPQKARVYLMYARDVQMGGMINLELDRDKFIIKESIHQPKEKDWRKLDKKKKK